MRRPMARFLPLIVVLLSAISLSPQPANGGSMSVWQARKTVIKGLQQVDPNATFLRSVPSNIKITAQSVEFFAAVGNCNLCPVPGSPSGSTYKFDLARIGTFGLAGSRQPGIGMARRREPGTGLLIDGREPHYTQNLFSVDCSRDADMRIWGLFFWRTSEETRAFADAMNRLRSAARGEGDGGQDGIWRDFPRKAAEWRASPSRPPLTEEVRRHRLVAENAIRENDFDTAVSEYIDGLESDPTWPEGHFNAALLMGELGYYSEAIRHMQAYVELVPEAPDAQAARDQIVIWGVKARKQHP